MIKKTINLSLSQTTLSIFNIKTHLSIYSIYIPQTFSNRNSLNSMDTTFKLQNTKNTLSIHHSDSFSSTSLSSFLCIHHIKFPALKKKKKKKRKKKKEKRKKMRKGIIACGTVAQISKIVSWNPKITPFL